MRFTSLATATCLAAYVSGAAVFLNPADPPGRKRQGLLGDLGFMDTGTTRIPAYLPTATSIAIPTPPVPHDSTTTTRLPFPNLGDVLSPQSSTTSTTSSSSTSSSTVSSTSTSSPPRTHTSSSSIKNAEILPTLPGTFALSSSVHPSSSDIPSWQPTVSPSSSPTGAPTSAISSNSVWKTVGISVSVITLIGLTILLVVFYEQWTAFVRDVFLCRSSCHEQDPLGDEDFLPGKNHEASDTSVRSYNRSWAREIRESARLSNIRYPTDVFYGDGSTLGPGKAGVGAGGGRDLGVGEFGHLRGPSRPSFLQRLSMLSIRAPSPVSPRVGTKSLSPGIEKAGDKSTASPSSPYKTSTF